jgi:TetR/AcrR family transcriptional regulator, transcriptional repressor for nem operon
LFKAGIVQHEAKTQDPKKLLGAYFAFHQGLADANRLCVCVALASDVESLDPETLNEVQSYFAESITWLAKVLEQGRKTKDLSFTEKPEILAANIQSATEGALLLARAFNDPKRVTLVSQDILKRLSG